MLVPSYKKVIDFKEEVLVVNVFKVNSFLANAPIYTPCKYQKIKGSPGGIKGNIGQ